MSDTILILDNIRSTHNVGSIFRTADAAGVSQLCLVGITPTPTDRFGRLRPEIAKTSLGASESLPWEHVGEHDSLSTNAVVSLVKRLQMEGYTVVALEQAPNACQLADFARPQKVAFVLGAEVAGVQTELLEIVDQIVELPMLGQKESLNVSVTAGIVLYHQLTQS